MPNEAIVAIVGRPNVGKSSLFNALIRERKSIVDPTAGVTRDINIGHAGGALCQFTLYDTAGYLESAEDRFNHLTQDKLRQAIAAADLLLFVVDGRESHPLDQELATFLRKSGKPVFLVINKIDHSNLETLQADFYVLGISHMLMTSVAQNRRIQQLLEDIEDHFIARGLAPEATEPTATVSSDSTDAAEAIRVAIVGRPNVGKSQLLNTLLGYNRSIVSALSGTTRDALDEEIEWQERKVCLIDTAGLRKKSHVKEDIEYYSNVRTVQAIERAHVVLLLMDVTEGIHHYDKRLVDIILQKGRGLILGLNKWDQIYPANPKDNYKLIQQHTQALWADLPEFPYVPVLPLSGLEAYKVDRVMDTVLRVYDDFRYRVPTSILNQWLAEHVRESHLDRPVSRLKVYYATQVLTAPPRFLFFINQKRHLRKDFGRFLENRLREAFEFQGVPIRISFREKGEERTPRAPHAGQALQEEFHYGRRS